MTAAQLRQLPGFLAFNTGVMFFIGVAVAFLEAKAPLAAVQLQALGAGVLIALVAVAAGFASAARVEFARRDGRRMPFFWFAPAALVGAPLGFRLGTGEALAQFPMLPAAGVGLALLGLAWALVQLRKVKA
jgi:hypothetical protein